MHISQKAKAIQQSPIRSMSILCRQKGGINMAQGLCDLDVPTPVLQGAKEGLQNGANSYTAAQGTRGLREAIANKQNSFYDQNIDGDNVLVSIGATGAFYSTAQTLLDPGDEVIVFEPYYGYHVATLKALGCKIRYVQTNPPQYTIDFDALESEITDKTKAVLICNPSNPSGKVYTKEELRTLGKLAQSRDLVVFSDEMYEHFVYDDAVFTSALSIDSLKDRCVVVSGFSKIYSITGWRLGYAISTQEVIEKAAALNDLVYVCPPAPLQEGVKKGLQELPKEYYTQVAKDHEHKRDLFIGALNEAGLKADFVKGAYYVLTDISSLPGEDEDQKVLYLLEHAGIAAVPGRAFYHKPPANPTARFCFSKQHGELESAIKGLQKQLHNLSM